MLHQDMWIGCCLPLHYLQNQPPLKNGSLNCYVIYGPHCIQKILVLIYWLWIIKLAYFGQLGWPELFYCNVNHLIFWNLKDTSGYKNSWRRQNCLVMIYNPNRMAYKLCKNLVYCWQQGWHKYSKEQVVLLNIKCGQM